MNNAVGAFSVSEHGTLTYRTGTTSAESMQMAWFDRTGKEIEPAGPPGPYRGVDLSPRMDAEEVGSSLTLRICSSSTL